MLLNEATEMVYIGQTINTLQQRIAKHSKDASHGSTTRIHQAIREFDIETFTEVVLQNCYDESELDAAEQWWADYTSSYEPGVGYNTYRPTIKKQQHVADKPKRRMKTKQPEQKDKRLATQGAMAVKNPRACRRGTDLSPEERLAQSERSRRAYFEGKERKRLACLRQHDDSLHSRHAPVHPRTHDRCKHIRHTKSRSAHARTLMKHMACAAIDRRSSNAHK